jgi:hypothetical protein
VRFAGAPALAAPAALLLPLLLLASCATVPRGAMHASPWAPLPHDANLYLYADVQEMRGPAEVLVRAVSGAKAGDAGLRADNAGLRALLDRAEEVYAGLYLRAPASGPAPGGPAVELVLTGRFSPELVGTRMSFSCGWVRHESFQPYWSARKQPLEVGSPAPGRVLVSVGRPGALPRMMARGREPEASLVQRVLAENPPAAAFVTGAAAWAWLPLGGEAASSLPGSAAPGTALPLRSAWFAARREGGLYELEARAELAGQASPRALAAAVRLAAASLLRRAGLPELVAHLRAMEVAVEGQSLVVRGLRLSEEETLSLLKSLVRPRREAADADGSD